MAHRAPQRMLLPGLTCYQLPRPVRMVNGYECWFWSAYTVGTGWDSASGA
jgi:hypothetical protein